MTRPVRVAVQIQPGGTPDYATWRDAVVAADDLGVDVIFGYDHFHRPAMKAIVDGKPVLFDDQPDVANFEGWTALASWGEITSHAEIGLLVTGVGYRNADLLADMANGVRELSPRRFPWRRFLLALSLGGGFRVASRWASTAGGRGVHVGGAVVVLVFHGGLSLRWLYYK